MIIIVTDRPTSERRQHPAIRASRGIKMFHHCQLTQNSLHLRDVSMHVNAKHMLFLSCHTFFKCLPWIRSMESNLSILGIVIRPSALNYYYYFIRQELICMAI